MAENERLRHEAAAQVDREAANMSLREYGIDLETLEAMFAEYKHGMPKSTIERRYLGTASNHGQLFSRLVRRYLGEETRGVHPLVIENRRLRALLVAHGIDPDHAEPTEGER